MSPAHHPSPRSRSGHTLPVEPLERRLLLATFIVNNATDAGGTGSVASRSLRQAINAANANNNDATVIDTIQFNIPGSGTHTIIPFSALPTITEAVEIDGSTQPGFTGSPLIELNGSNAGSAVFGLRITAGRSTVRALAINRFGGLSGGGGISLETAGSNVIVGCRIGTNPGGTLDFGNVGPGISITVPPGNRSGSRIGGTAAADLNIIGGNSFEGISIQDSDGNTILGNRIGVTGGGASAVPNGQAGVSILNGNDNLIGGTQPGARNYISGNNGPGVSIQRTGIATAVDNIVQGNYIGLSITGNSALANGNFGVVLNGAGGNIIGGNTPAARNIISGNSSTGVQIANAGASNNLVQGNYIGTNFTGNAAIPNGNGGVQINMASGNTIGGSTSAGERNLISGNTGPGVFITRPGANANFVQGNLIGLAADGATPLANTTSGVILSDALSNIIGGGAPANRNIISANGSHGVQLQDGSDAAVSGSDSNIIRGNFIGTDAAGTLDRGNAADGVNIGPLCDINSIDVGNLIAFNAGDGIAIAGPANAGTGNDISANSIFSNDQLGIDLHNNGVTPNDNNDTDTGANFLMNFPVLSAVNNIAAGTRVVGSLNTNTASGQHRIEFFASPAPDPSGFGEGKTYLGGTTLNLAAGNTINFNLVVGATTPGQYVTATATRLSTGSTSEFSAAVVAVDVAPPQITAAEFHYQTAPHAVMYTFSENVAASLSPADLTLKNLTTNTTIPNAQISLSYTPGMNIAAFMYTPGVLPDGNYQATLAAAGVTDSVGNPLASDHVLDFFFLNADANHDRSVGFADLVILAQNYAQSNKDFTQGDFSYNTTVGFEDLVLLAQRYGTTLPAAPVLASESQLLPARRHLTQPVFNLLQPIRRLTTTPSPTRA
jgi:hypothetical protein